MSNYKIGIFEESQQKALLEACKSETEYLAIWIFMRLGMHPKNYGELKIADLDIHNYIHWDRVKNKCRRHEMLPEDIADRLKKYLKWTCRPKGRTQLWGIVRAVGERIGIGGLSPMSLRKTFCIQLLREYEGHQDKLDMVAKRMGCKRETVIQNYIELDGWEKLSKKKRR